MVISVYSRNDLPQALENGAVDAIALGVGLLDGDVGLEASGHLGELGSRTGVDASSVHNGNVLRIH